MKKNNQAAFDDEEEHKKYIEKVSEDYKKIMRDNDHLKSMIDHQKERMTRLSHALTFKPKPEDKEEENASPKMENKK